MRRFVALLSALEFAQIEPRRIDALRRYLATAPAADAAWAVALLSGRRQPRVVRRDVLRQWVQAHAALSEPLLASCESSVGHPFEAWSLLWPAPVIADETPLATWMGECLPTLAALDEAARATQMAHWMTRMEPQGRELLFRLLTGEALARWPAVGLQRAIAGATTLDLPVVAIRWPLHGPKEPAARARAAGRRLAQGRRDSDRLPALAAWCCLSRPVDADEQVWLPVRRASRKPLDRAPEALGDAGQWMAVACPRGKRVQWVHLAGRSLLWSSEGELVSEHFQNLGSTWPLQAPEAILEGVMVEFTHDSPGSQQFVALDLLACDGHDVARWPASHRRRRLESLLEGTSVPIAPCLHPNSWDELRQRHTQAHFEGVAEWWLERNEASGEPAEEMDSPPRLKATSLTWMAAEQRLLALVAYAQPRPPGWSQPDPQPHTQLVPQPDPQACPPPEWHDGDVVCSPAVGEFQFTLGLWNRPPSGASEAATSFSSPPPGTGGSAARLQLMPVAVTALVSDAEALRQLEAHVREHTVERFGPARRLWPALPVEIAFTQARVSRRHKGGWLLLGARILRVRADLDGHEAGSLIDLGAPDR